MELRCQRQFSCRDLHTPTEGERGSRMGFSVPLKLLGVMLEMVQGEQQKPAL
jgi:hypothetical protein